MKNIIISNIPKGQLPWHLLHIGLHPRESEAMDDWCKKYCTGFFKLYPAKDGLSFYIQFMLDSDIENFRYWWCR